MKKIAIATAVVLTAASFGTAVLAQNSAPDFATADSNKDGSVSFEEAVGAYPGLTQAIFDQADSNKDGSLNETEFAGLEGLSAAFEGVVTNGGDTSASASGSPPSPPNP